VNSVALFTDVSLNPKLKLGVGAYLVVPAIFLEVSPHSIEISELAKRLVVRRFEGASSTTLEVQTVLWALEDYRNALKVPGLRQLHVYSDSQCIAGLLRRRPKLEVNGFHSKKTNRLLKNAFLYRKYYELYDELRFEVIKVAGHTRSCSRDTVHRIFSLVDKQVRKALNLLMDESE
jgi:ribonuclease HI